MTSANLGRREPDRLAQGKRRQPVIRLPGGKLANATPGVRYKMAPGAVDVCFVFDTTGSMSDKISALTNCVDELVIKLSRMSLDWRVTTVPFGDLTVQGDRIVSDQPFVRTADAARKQLYEMPRFSGGGNIGESSCEAMHAACNKAFRGPVVKVVILITDEPALGAQQALSAVHGSLELIDAACFTVAPRFPYFVAWAEQHGGEWQLIGRDLNVKAIEQLFRSLIRRVAELSDSVNRLGGGSVRAFLERGS